MTGFKEIGRKLSNWGRWGTGDQLGTVNFITDEHRRAAAGLIRTGRLIELGMPFGDDGPQTGDNGRFNPIHRMSMLPADKVGPEGQLVADDMIVMPLQCATQWDSLAHIGYDGLLYNNVPAAAVTAKGANRNSIDHVVGRLVGRGVLLDVASVKGVPSLTAGEEITADDLTAAQRSQGVEVRRGDIVLVRTGWYRYFRDKKLGVAYVSDKVPGLGVSCCEWLYEREVAAVAADNQAVEVKPSIDVGVALPVHMILIRDLGMTLGEMFDLEDLAIECAADGVYEFFFSGVGLKVSNAVGSPVSPIAIR